MRRLAAVLSLFFSACIGVGNTSDASEPELTPAKYPVSAAGAVTLTSVPSNGFSALTASEQQIIRITLAQIEAAGVVGQAGWEALGTESRRLLEESRLPVGSEDQVLEAALRGEPIAWQRLDSETILAEERNLTTDFKVRLGESLVGMTKDELIATRHRLSVGLAVMETVALNQPPPDASAAAIHELQKTALIELREMTNAELLRRGVSQLD